MFTDSSINCPFVLFDHFLINDNHFILGTADAYDVLQLLCIVSCLHCLYLFILFGHIKVLAKNKGHISIEYTITLSNHESRSQEAGSGCGQNQVVMIHAPR